MLNGDTHCAWGIEREFPDRYESTQSVFCIGMKLPRFSHAKSTSISQRLLLLLFFQSSMACYAQDFIYTIKPGDTLSSISREFLKNPGEWRKLQEANRIDNPNRIFPSGQIVIPGALLKSSTVATVLRNASGSVKVQDRTGREYALTNEMAIEPAYTLLTGAGASIQIEYGDGLKSTVQENSVVEIQNQESVGSNRDVRLYLHQGEVRNQVKTQGSGSTRFVITTPSAVASVRGTQFRVGVDAVMQQFRAEVTDGVVNVKNDAGESAVTEGFGVVVKNSRARIMPQKLLPAVDLSRLKKRFDGEPVSFVFPPLEGAMAYRSEVSERDTGRQLYSHKANTPSAKFPNLGDGHYRLEIFAYDLNNLGGIEALHSFDVINQQLSRRTKAPTLNYPKNAAMIGNRDFAFRWTATESTEYYRIQIAKDPGFVALAKDIFPYPYNVLNIANELPSGKYYWRVIALKDADSSVHGAAAYSDVQSFRIAPHTPRISTVNLENGKLTFSWDNDEYSDALKYRIQISSTSRFEQLIAEQQTPETQFQIDLDDTGEYFARVQAIEADGFAGEQSPAHQFRIFRHRFFSKKLENIEQPTVFSEQ